MFYGYVRVSTDDQKKNGSPEEQERKIRGVAMARGADDFSLLMYHDLAVSGATPLSNRPAGSEMLEQLRPGDIIIAAKLDRLFRSASNALAVVEDLKEQGVGLIIADFGIDPITESIVGKLIFTVLSGCAEFERARIAERTNDGRRAKKRSGGVVGTVPFGFGRVGQRSTARLVDNPDERRVIAAVAEACQRFPYEGLPDVERVRYVMRHLDRCGARSRAGKSFQWVQVKRLIDRHYQQQFKESA